MKSAQRLMIASAIVLIASCSSLFPSQSPLGRILPLTTGQAKLTEIEMPGHVHENLPYTVILDFQSNGPVTIEKVCFRWLSRQPSFSTSSANCFMGNCAVSGPVYNYSSLSSQTGTTTPASNQFCVGASHIKLQSPGRLIVTIRPENLHPDYTMLEAQLEYRYKGVLLETNSVQTPVIVGK